MSVRELLLVHAIAMATIEFEKKKFSAIKKQHGSVFSKVRVASVYKIRKFSVVEGASGTDHRFDLRGEAAGAWTPKRGV